MGRDLLDAGDLARAIAAGTEWLGANKEFVNSLNVFPVPDGDTGTNMHLTLLSAVREAEKAGGTTLSEVADAAAMGSLMGARGNSGVILSQLLRGFAKGVEGKAQLRAQDLAQALQSAAAMAYKAVMKPVEGTMLTVAREAARSATQGVRAGLDVLALAEKVLEDARAALERTPELLPTLREAGVVDAGGQGLVFFWEGAVKALRGEMTAGRQEPLLQVARATGSSQAARQAQSEATVKESLRFRYCTEFLLKGRSLPLDRIRQELADAGDCLLVVGTSDVAKVHVHTNHPGRVLEYCLRLGDLHEIQINNMADQHDEFEAMGPPGRPVGVGGQRNGGLLETRAARAGVSVPAEARPRPEAVEKPVGIVAVAVGEGLATILRSLGADVVVEGGQTMNPSIEELANAARRVNAKSVIILPNNSNVILTADRVREFVEDKAISVVPTKTIPQGVAALVAFNAASDIAANARAMNEALSHVSTGEVTYAVRSSSVNGFSIDQNDVIGIKDGDICAAGKDRDEVAMSLASQMVTEESSLLTLYYGQDVSATEAQALGERLSDIYPHCEVEVHYGGQPLYYYIMSAE
ncbi:MAG: DAK2 domain-containing protein [Firmicutes bacterium]|nr:DAK2 domain-containing protein [Bacillota bacterium]MDH7494889.1 DAK2 domain-containing protein [Bacillota bacterium]